MKVQSIIYQVLGKMDIFPGGATQLKVFQTLLSVGYTLQMRPCVCTDRKPVRSHNNYLPL